MRSDQGVRGDQRRLSVVIRLALVLAACFALAASATAQTDGRIRIIGRALVEVAPDYVTVRVGVSNRAPTPTAALDQNSAVARRLIDFSKQFGVEPREIQTDAVNLQPSYKTVRDSSGTTRQEPDGYAANNTVSVKLTDLSRLGVFMRQVLDQGATNIGGVQFGIADPEKSADEARLKAVEDAVRQANQLAQAANVKLGRILEIVHPPRGQFQVAGGVADLPARRLRAASVPIEAGTVEIGAEVEMIWALE
jgi:uncharacterized protein